MQDCLCRIIKDRTVHGKYIMIKTRFQGFYLQQLIFCSIWELFMEAVLQNFCNVSHAITTCKTKSIRGISNSKQHAFTYNMMNDTASYYQGKNVSEQNQK